MPDHEPSAAGDSSSQHESVHLLSVVIPVYQGEKTLESLVLEIEPFSHNFRSPGGRLCKVEEVVLVHDGAIDRSDVVMESLARRFAFVKLVWLSRNFGQHPATLAGMSSTTTEWVVTMDEDGQHNPADIGAMLDAALADGVPLVYAAAKNAPPHGFLRNLTSAGAKWIFIVLLGNKEIGNFNSFRLVRGDIARSLAAYCGTSVFLDVALSWVVADATHCPVYLRTTPDRKSGYSYRKLIKHFLRLALTSGTKPLRVIAVLGLLSIFIAILISVYALWMKVTQSVPVQGWASTVIVMSFFSGCILFSLGIIAEYVAVALNTMMGRPLYLVASRPMHKTNARS